MLTLTTLKTTAIALGTYACLAAVSWQYRDHPTITRHLNTLDFPVQVSQVCPAASNGAPLYGPAC